MYKFWYNYIKPKHEQNAKLWYMDTDSFIINIRTEDFYEDISNDVEKPFYTSNYEIINNNKYLKVRHIINILEKLTLSSNDNKRLQTFDKITVYSYDTSIAKVYKSCHNS